MDLEKDDIFAGIAGINLPCDHFDLGHGLTLRRTFAHFMAPFMMAFSPAEPGKGHPAPWSAVSGGLGFDLYVQLHIPSTFSEVVFFDRLNTAWWIVALLRLRGAPRAHAPVIADRPFADISKNWSSAKIIPVEVTPRRLAAEPIDSPISQDDLEWVKSVWESGARLMRDSSSFNDAFQALDSAGSMPNQSVSLLTVWGALEHLFSPAKQELRFRVSANIAAYLEAPGTARLTLHRKLMKLYDARSVAAHGAGSMNSEAWIDTAILANRVLHKILSDRQVPSKDQLESALFSSG